MTNPQRLGLEFQGIIANPRDVLTFIRPKARNTRNVINEPELEIDQMDLGVQEKVGFFSLSASTVPTICLDQQSPSGKTSAGVSWRTRDATVGSRRNERCY